MTGDVRQQLIEALRRIDFEKWDVRLSLVEAVCFGMAIGVILGAIFGWTA